MSKPKEQVEEPSKGRDLVLVTIAIIVAVAGVLAFTFLSDQSLGVRLACLAAGLVVGCAIAWFSPSASGLSPMAAPLTMSCASLSGRLAAKP